MSNLSIEDVYKAELEEANTRATVWQARARQAEEEVKELERQAKASAARERMYKRGMDAAFWIMTAAAVAGLLAHLL